MPKDPKRNLQSYQLQGGHLNEFEFQKSQGEVAQESGRSTDKTGNPDVPQATKRIAKVTAEAHRIVQKRKKGGVAKAGAQRRKTAGKKSTRKVATKSPKKSTPKAGVKKRSGVKRRSKKAGR